MDGRNQEILNMTKVTTTIEHSDKKSTAVTKFSSLSPEAIASILQNLSPCRVASGYF